MYVNKHQVIHSYRNFTSSLFLLHLAIAFILEAIYSHCAYIMEIMGKDLIVCFFPSSSSVVSSSILTAVIVDNQKPRETRK